MLAKGMIAGGVKVVMFKDQDGKIMLTVDNDTVECKTEEIARASWESFRNILMGKGRV